MINRIKIKGEGGVWLMQCVQKNSDTIYMNVESFSKAVSEKWDIHSDVIRNYIFANVSIGLARNNEIKEEIDQLYIADQQKYYHASKNSSCINHIMMTQGTLEQEIYARKVLGLLVVAEVDYDLRSSVIKILRKYYPSVYKSVKKISKKELKNRYMQMDKVTRSIEASFDGAVYLYIAICSFAEMIDQGFIMSILNDIEYFEFAGPMTENINEELKEYQSKIQEIKTLIEREYGTIFSYKDIINNDNEYIKNLSMILKNLFIINKLDINLIFCDSELLNIDEIILSYIKSKKKLEPELIIQSIVSGIFVQSLIYEYKNSRTLYFENNEETLFFEIQALEEKLKNVETENQELTSQLENLSEQQALYDKNLNYEINKLNKIHRSEMNSIKNKIKDLENQLENQLLEERKYKVELEVLTEHVLKVKSEYVPTVSEKTLDYYVQNKKIIIIGGDKDWRRKFRDKYPEIRTLNGFNENFDINILINADYIFFYSKFMNHSTFYRAMNIIRAKQRKFGYIGKTNIELVEQELLEELTRCEAE